MGIKIGKALMHRINDELVGGYLLLENGNYWSFVAAERESNYGIFFGGYAIEGCNIEKDERKDGVFWVTINDPKERTEGGCAKVLKATRCHKDGDDVEFEEEPTFTAALYPSGIKGFLQGYMYQEVDDDDVVEVKPAKSKTSTTKTKSKKSSKSSNSSFAW